jgi:hypothetical protein
MGAADASSFLHAKPATVRPESSLRNQNFSTREQASTCEE